MILHKFSRQTRLYEKPGLTLPLTNRPNETWLRRFFQAIPETERNFLHFGVLIIKALQSCFGGPNWDNVIPILKQTFLT